MVDAYFMAHFDPNEYLLVDEIRSVAEVSPKFCDDRDKMNSYVNHMFLTATKLKNYSKNIPDNDKTIILTDELYEEVYKLDKRYDNPDKVSKSYCKMKLSIIEKSSETIQQVMGSKPR
jgi:cytochrome c peroxidase